MTLWSRLARVRPRRVREEIEIRFERAQRWVSQRRRFGAGVSSRAIFVVGCQRSGTNMVMWTLERSPDVWVHHEHSRNAAFVDFRLRHTPVVERLIRRAPAPVVAFKPICDSHLTARYLERHPSARAIWVYRRYPDVANSLVRAFGGHEKDILRWIVRGDWDWLDWRGEGLRPEVVEFVRDCFHESMKDEEAASLVWWMRTRFYLDQGLDRDERVLLVRYEDLVQDPGTAFERVFAFTGLPFDPAYGSHVFASSIGKNRYPGVSGEIRKVCDELQERMDAAFQSQASPPTAGTAA